MKEKHTPSNTARLIKDPFLRVPLARKAYCLKSLDLLSPEYIGRFKRVAPDGKPE